MNLGERPVRPVRGDLQDGRTPPNGRPEAAEQRLHAPIDHEPGVRGPLTLQMIPDPVPVRPEPVVVPGAKGAPQTCGVLGVVTKPAEPRGRRAASPGKDSTSRRSGSSGMPETRSSISSGSRSGPPARVKRSTSPIVGCASRASGAVLDGNPFRAVSRHPPNRAALSCRFRTRRLNCASASAPSTETRTRTRSSAVRWIRSTSTAPYADSDIPARLKHSGVSLRRTAPVGPRPRSRPNADDPVTRTFPGRYGAMAATR
jgi:hypothetical protein